MTMRANGSNWWPRWIARWAAPLLAAVMLAGPTGAVAQSSAAPACWSDVELMAETAMDFLFQQEAVANICDPILRPTDVRAERLMTRMSREIARKFQANFTKYERLRTDRFKLRFGADWEVALEEDRLRKYQAFLKSHRLGVGVCKNLREEYEIRLSSGWDYLKAKLDHSQREARATAKMCKIVEN